MTTRLLFDERFLSHDPGPGHPERADRLRAVVEELSRSRAPGLEWRPPRRATREELLRVHDEALVSAIESLQGHGRFDADTAYSPGSRDAALLAAGAALSAVEAVCRGEADTAFALVRPPGHHAVPAEAMGFCLLNNAALAAAHARATLGCERVLFIDWDVHHGNGSQDAFYAREDVLFCSAHRHPFYPGTGALEEIGRGAGEGFTVNLPLPEGLGDADYAALFRDVLVPVADAYRPDLVLVSAGFDPHRDDPLGDMRVTEEGFAALCGIVRELALRHAGGRLALVLEGGYDLDGLARGVRACVEVLSGAVPPTPGPPSDRFVPTLRRLREHHARSGRRP